MTADREAAIREKWKRDYESPDLVDCQADIRVLLDELAAAREREGEWRRKAGREGVRANNAEGRVVALSEALRRWLACSFKQMRMERGKGHCPHTVAFGGDQEKSCMMLAEETLAALSEGEG